MPNYTIPYLRMCYGHTCLNEFYPRTGNHKYCSDECQLGAKRVQSREHEARNRDSISSARRGHQFSQRQEAISKLGDCCVKCGFSDMRALQIDHKHGRNRGPRDSWSTLYKSVMITPKKYQLLCAHCNWIKRCEMKEATGRPRKED